MAEPAHQTLAGNFAWVQDFDLTPEIAQELGLVKGVCLIEGRTKSGDMFDSADVIQGVGAMRAAALLGAGNLNIDHLRKLPDSYEKKYPGISEHPYPVGFIIDAQAVKRDDGKWLGEFLGSVFNKVLYALIRDHKVVGNSVEDVMRKEDCSDCSGNVCTCHPEGSAFLENAVILEEVPNVDGTWIAPVTADDIGTIITNETHYATPMTPLMLKLNALVKRQHVSDYFTGDTWTNGAESIRDYLVDEKDIDAAVAEQMAQYLYENPTVMTPTQMTNLSRADLEAWWGLFTLKLHVEGLEQKVATLAWLKHNATPMGVLKKTRHTRESIHYKAKAATDATCASCKWHADSDSGPVCMALGGVPVDAAATCDLHTAAKAGYMPNPDDVIPPPKTNTQNAGGPPSGAPAPATDTPPKSSGQGSTGSGTPPPAPPGKTHAAPAPPKNRPVVEPRPSVPAADADAALEKQIGAIDSQLAVMSQHLVMTPRKGKRGQKIKTDFDNLKAERDRLAKLKKN